MLLGAVLLVLAGLFALFVGYQLNKKTNRLKFLSLMLASIAFLATQLAFILRFVLTSDVALLLTSHVIEWGHIYCLTLVLSSLLLFVRESKPEFSQFPRVYALLPFLIILSYLLVYDTIVIKNWLLRIYEGGAAVVAFLIYGVYSMRNNIYNTIAAGAGLLLVAFFASLAFAGYGIIWQLFLAAGIVTVFSGYMVVENQFEA